MCLAVPGQIIELRDGEAVVDFQGSQMTVSTIMTPEVKLNGWVLVHAGFAISVLEEEEARETWSYLKAIAEEPPPDA